MSSSQLRVILDVRGLMLHAYHAGTDKKPLKGIKGPINTAAHGLANFIEMYLKPVLSNVAPINVIAVWEGGNDRRRVLLPQYKERPGQEDSDPLMKEQVATLMLSLKKLLAGIGALQVSCPTVEADDTIAYLCERLQGSKLVYTVDNDLLQLMSYPDTVVVGKLKSTSSYKGYPISMVAMFKSIVGDTSDGYGGVSGLGEASFGKLVDYVGHDGIAELEECVNSSDFTRIEEALQEEDHPILRKLYDNRDQWRLSYILARLHPEWCEYSFGDKLVRPVWYKRLPSRERTADALVSAGLTSVVPDFLLRFLPSQTGIDADSIPDLDRLRREVAKSPVVGFDYESYDYLNHPDYQKARAGYIDVLSQRVTGASYCFGDNLQHTIYASLLHRDTKNLSVDQFLDLMEVMLSDKIPVAQNCFSGDTEFLTKEGVFTLAEKEGKTVQVWTEQGWKEGTVKKGGVQKLYRLSVGPKGRSRSSVVEHIRTTANHRWMIERKKKRVEGYVTTSELQIRDTIVSEVPVPAIDYASEAFKHGLIFADGCLIRNRSKEGSYAHNIRFCGKKNKWAYLFDTTQPVSANGDHVANYYVTPYNCKEVPETTSAEYIANFIEGWQVMDGTETSAPNKYTRVLYTSNEEVIGWIRKNAPLAGWYVTGISCHTHLKKDGAYKDVTTYYVVLSKDPKMGWTIKSIEEDEEEEVFCVEVPEVGRFTLGAGIYTANCKFEQVLSKTNFDVEFPKIYDTAILASYVDEEMEQGLKAMSKRLLNYDQTTYRQVVPAGKDMRDVSLGEVLHYGCDDAFVTAHLFVLYKTICECERTWDFIDKYEVNFDYVFMKSFIEGIPVDLSRLKELSVEDDKLYTETEAKLRSLLEEHCSNYNETGYMQMWEDLREFTTLSLREKAEKHGEELTQEQLDTELKNKSQELREATRYVPLKEPVHLFTPFGKAALSAASKTLGLPGIRVVKLDKLIAWCDGIRKQSVDNNIPLNEDQLKFLDTLEGAAAACLDTGVPSVFLDQDFEEYCQTIVYGNKELHVGDELNVNSPKQIAELIYGKMALPILVRNEDKKGTTARTRYDMEGAPGTNEIAIKTILAELGEDDKEEEDQSWQARVLNYILILRGINTRRSLYYTPYPLLVSPVDGRIHPGIRNCGTKTRRPSSSTPNILQVSKKEGATMREPFLPLSKDHLIVSIDFVQQELVIMAGESGDPNLRACYVGDNKLDVHSSTAASLLGMSYEDFLELYKSKDKKATNYRKKYAKIVNFLTSYGGSVVGLARKAVIPKEQAQEFLDAFFEKYPRVKEYQERMETLALRHGFVTDCFGVRKHCDGIYSDNKRMQRALARQAGNHPIQGAAASVLKIAVTKIRETELLERTGAVLYAPIYDEVVASVPVSKIVEFIRGMESCMEMELPGLDISLNTSVSIGRNWKEASLNELGEKPTTEKINEVISKLLENA